MAKYCVYCGNPLKESDKFCIICGKPVLRDLPKPEKGDKIRDSTEKIREETDKIDEEVEPKRAKTYGDPICELY